MAALNHAVITIFFWYLKCSHYIKEHNDIFIKHLDRMIKDEKNPLFKNFLKAMCLEWEIVQEITIT